MFCLVRLEFVVTAFTILATFIGNNFYASAEGPRLLQPITNSAIYNSPYRFFVNLTTEYVFFYNASDISILDGARIHVQSDDATFDYPVIVVVRQKKGILAWQVPLKVKSKEYVDPTLYRNTSRNLCPSQFYEYINFQEQGEHVTISISTASPNNISFYLELKPVQDFYVEIGDSRTFDVTPSEPVYYGYLLKNASDDRSVLVKVTSESNVCMTFSIEKTSCPVFSYEGNTKLAGYWQTVTTHGGITVPLSAYRHGFFIVFLINTDDSDCSTNSSETVHNRQKTVHLTIDYTIATSNYILPLFSMAALFIGFSVAYIVGIISYKVHRCIRPPLQVIENIINDSNQSINSIQAQPEEFLEPESSSSHNDGNDDPLQDVAIISSIQDLLATRNNQVENKNHNIFLIDLAQQEGNVLCTKSRLYLNYVATVAVFYTAPVVQLVITNQWELHKTGNEDLCYYNFECSHPLWFLSDFNHVFSNSGYILLGLLFMFIVYTRSTQDSLYFEERKLGIPQYYGLFYAMGFALMMEGVLSGCYHVCPNRSNFQFDTSFMYIIVVLCMVKLYQNRHPDIHAEAPVTFGVLAQTILIALAGIITTRTSIVWICFTIVHIAFCLLLSVRIYYLDRINIELPLFHQRLKNKLYDIYMIIKLQSRPLYSQRLVLLIIGNLCNIGVAIYGNMSHVQDFGTYLLMILMLNLILYTSFYIIMKLCHKERILFQPAIYLFLSTVTWFGALWFFVDNTTTWSTTAAESRTHNQPCFWWLFNFYDTHDVWHFLSALAIFFSFMTLLTLDDDISNVHCSRISVF